jgi:DNA-binding PadR family transcriptional regulator
MQRDTSRSTSRSATRDPGLLILASLAAGPRHGYAMVEDIAAFGGGRLGPGTLYGALARLEESGLIEPLDADDRRRPYRITPAGMTALAGEIDALELVVRTVRDRLAEPSA